MELDAAHLRAAATNGNVILATSSPDRLSGERRKNILRYAGGIFVRGEFVTHRARRLNQSPLPLPPSNTVMDNFSRVATRVASAVSDSMPIYYRLGDYPWDDGRFWETKGHQGLRGSGLLLANPALLEQEFRVAERLQGTGNRLRVILPFVTSPEEQQQLTEIVRARLNPGQIGVMVENLRHVECIDEFPTDDIQFVFPGPGDLGDELRRTTGMNDLAAEERIIALGQELALRTAAQGIRHYLAFRCLAGQIKSDFQVVHNVYVPGELPVVA